MLNISNPTTFSAHRSGWSYVMNNLMRFNSLNNLMLDDFVDITFGYHRNKNILSKKIPYLKPWVGFIHHPPKICPWYNEDYKRQIDIHYYMRDEAFLASLEKCEGLFTLSHYLKNYLLDTFDCFKNIPIFVLKHPTSFNNLLWDFNKFKKSAGRKTRVANIGYFLRILSSVFTADFAGKPVERLLLPSSMSYALNSLNKEIEYKNLKIDKSKVRIIDWQNNNFYDKLLEQSLVMLNLYDTSCNNAIIEPIVRNCPILINKHPATQEYLGKKYPLYTDFSKPIDINHDRIYDAYKYLKELDKKDLTIELFSEKFEKHILNISNKGKPKSTRKNNLTKQKNIICKSNSFNHRYGWQWVTKKMEDSFSKKRYVKSHSDIYINDFTEHVFGNHKSENVKHLQIGGITQIGIYGKSLLKYKDTEIYQNSYKQHYIWNTDTLLWEPVKLSPHQKKYIQFLQSSFYKDNNWVGMFHNPIDMPKWFSYYQNLNYILENEEFLEALPNCRLFVTFSKDQKQRFKTILQSKNIKVPRIVSLYHPTPSLNSKKWFDLEKYFSSKKILQVGYWQRNLHKFLCTEFRDHQKYLFFSDKYCAEILNMEHKISPLRNKISQTDINSIIKAIKNYQVDHPICINKINVIKTKTNTEYDKFLKSSVLFSNYYDLSASNTLLEAISYKTPILLNRKPASEEYLGKDYPLFYDSMSQATALLNKENSIIDAHEHLKSINTEKFNIDNFLIKLNDEITR